MKRQTVALGLRREAKLLLDELEANCLHVAKIRSSKATDWQTGIDAQ